MKTQNDKYMSEKQILTLNHRHTQAYVVSIDNIYIMIDSGYPESLSTFEKILKEYNIEFSQIKYLLITHFHPDHAGLTQVLLDYGIQLLLHESQKEYIEKVNNYFAKYFHEKYKPIILENNDKISLLDTEESINIFNEHKLAGKIISTPGHTDDSITFIIDDIAFTGDLPNYNVMELYKSEIISDSWKKIIESNVKEIYPGHGDKYNLAIL
jgi:glyoxylase-like metal-dependent hydrolase (beta-lactamase superfamily II)